MQYDTKAKTKAGGVAPQSLPLASHSPQSLPTWTAPERTEPAPLQRLAADLSAFTRLPVKAQHQTVQPLFQAASLQRAEEGRLSEELLAVRRQLVQLPQANAVPPRAAVPIPSQPVTAGEWVTVMRHRAEQIDGQRLSSRDHDGFLSLQRQVAQTLVQGFRQDRQAPDARYAHYGEQLATLHGHANSASVSRVVLGLIPQRERPALQRALDEAVQRQAEQEAQDQTALQFQALQRKKAELEEEALQPVMQRIGARRGAGNPLPAAVQRHLEQGLNHDLSRVRIHDDAEADKLSKKVNALAFTTGTDIFFQRGQFNPNTRSGLELLAHEVTHTVQQAQGKVGTGIDPDAGLEAEAQNTGRVLAAQASRVKSTRQSISQRPTLLPPPTQSIQRRAGSQQTPPTGYVKAFQEQVQQAALKTLSQNEQRLKDRQKMLADTSVSNPAWKNFQQLAQKNAEIEGLWQRLSQQVNTEVQARAHTSVIPVRRISDQRDALIQSIYLNWYDLQGSTAPPTATSTQVRLSRFNASVTTLQARFDQLARIEDARDYLHAQYPEVALLAKQLGAASLAAQPNTPAAHAGLKTRLAPEYQKTLVAIAQLRSKVRAGKLPLDHMNVLLAQVMDQQGIKPKGSTDPKSQAVNSWLDSQQQDKMWVDIGLVLATLGFTVAAIFAPQFVLPTAAALATGLTLSRRTLLDSQGQQAVSNTQALGGQKLSSVSPEEARIQVVLGQVDILLGVAGAATGAFGMVRLASVARSGTATGRALEAEQVAQQSATLAQTGRYRRWIAGSVNLKAGPNGAVRVRVPPEFPPRLSRLPGGKLPAPPAVLKDLALKLHLAQYCDNWSSVAPFIGQKMKFGPKGIPELPPGYRYAKSRLNSGEIVHVAYLPDSNVNWLPKLKLDKQGTWQPEGVTWKADKLNPQVGTLETNHRLAQSSVYSTNFLKVLTGKDESQLHHMLADNVIRKSPFFQWAMERGLFNLDDPANIIELAATPASLLKANPLGQPPRLAPYVHSGSHKNTDLITEGVIRIALERRGIDVYTLSGLREPDTASIIKKIQEDLREMYKNKQMPAPDGTRLGQSEDGTREQA
jgi:hypothetical protein